MHSFLPEHANLSGGRTLNINCSDDDGSILSTNVTFFQYLEIYYLDILVAFRNSVKNVGMRRIFGVYSFNLIASPDWMDIETCYCLTDLIIRVISFFIPIVLLLMFLMLLMLCTYQYRYHLCPPYVRQWFVNP